MRASELIRSSANGFQVKLMIIQAICALHAQLLCEVVSIVIPWVDGVVVSLPISCQVLVTGLLQWFVIYVLISQIIRQTWQPPWGWWWRLKIRIADNWFWGPFLQLTGSKEKLDLLFFLLAKLSLLPPSWLDCEVVFETSFASPLWLRYLTVSTCLGRSPALFAFEGW